MNRLQKFILNLFKFLFCLFVTMDIPYTLLIFHGHEHSWQIKLYILILVILAAVCWGVLFSKLRVEIKSCVVILAILFNYSANLLPDAKHTFDLETCLDMSICKEGLRVKSDNGNFTVTRENCLNHGYKWDEKRKTCEIINTSTEFLTD